MADFDTRMEALRQRFRDRCAERRPQLAAALAAGDQAAIAAIAHELAGNGGLFGYGELSARAKELEDIARALPADEEQLNHNGGEVLRLLEQSSR